MPNFIKLVAVKEEVLLVKFIYKLPWTAKVKLPGLFVRENYILEDHLMNSAHYKFMTLKLLRRQVLLSCF